MFIYDTLLDTTLNSFFYSFIKQYNIEVFFNDARIRLILTITALFNI